MVFTPQPSTSDEEQKKRVPMCSPTEAHHPLVIHEDGGVVMTMGGTMDP
jgi:hypothetical protein